MKFDYQKINRIFNYLVDSQKKTNEFSLDSSNEYSDALRFYKKLVSGLIDSCSKCGRKLVFEKKLPDDLSLDSYDKSVLTGYYPESCRCGAINKVISAFRGDTIIEFDGYWNQSERDTLTS